MLILSSKRKILFKILLILSACSHFTMVFSSKEGDPASPAHGPRHHRKNVSIQQHKQRLLTANSSLERCTANLFEATKKYAYMFSQEAFVDFINTQSDGSIMTQNFDSTAIIALTFDFWILTCKVKRGDCTNDEPVSVYDILNYRGDNGESNVLADFCERINDKIMDLVIPSPSQEPTDIPSSYPTKLPTVYPTAYPSASPVQSPSWKPSQLASPSPTLSHVPTSTPSASPSVSVRPSTVPTLSLTGPKGPSKDPSPRPTASPTVTDSFTLTFSVGYNVSNAQDLMITWAEDVAYDVLVTIDPDCTRETSVLCPLTLRVSVFLNVRDCDDFATNLSAETCALADLTVALSSTDSFDSSILNAISRSVRDRRNELVLLLQP